MAEKVSRIKEKTQKRFYYISVLSVVSALAVVMLHSNMAFWAYREGGSWALNNIIECLFYFAVPVFFMITGATLFDYQDRYDTKTFFRHRFSKVLIPFVVWSLFGLFFYSVLRGFHFSLNPVDIWNDFFQTKYVGIFWFFIPLIGIYLATPLFAAIDKKKKINTLKYVAVLGVILNVVVPFVMLLIKYYTGTELAWRFSLDMLGGYLIYPVIGYLLHNVTLEKKQRIIIYVLAVCGLLVHIIGTYCLSRNDGMIVEVFKEYRNLPCLLYSVGIFVLIKSVAESKFMKKFEKFVNVLSKYTFAIYLTHSFILAYMVDFLKNFNIEITSVVFVPIAFVLTVPLCVAITWMVRKIPGGKYIMP